MWNGQKKYFIITGFLKILKYFESTQFLQHLLTSAAYELSLSGLKLKSFSPTSFFHNVLVTLFDPCEAYSRCNQISKMEILRK